MDGWRLGGHRASCLASSGPSLPWPTRCLPGTTLPPPLSSTPLRGPGAVGGWHHHVGLVPSWAPDPLSGPRPINARAETLLEKRLFVEPFLRRRCLVPVDGFYEWRALSHRPKQPYFIAARDGSPLAIAGVWDRWNGPDGERIVSVALVTTPANDVVASLHDRMPAVLPPSAWDAWRWSGKKGRVHPPWLKPTSPRRRGREPG